MLTLAASRGTLTAFSGSTSLLLCTSPSHRDAGPYPFRLSRPTRLTRGTFSFTVRVAPAGSGPLTVTVTGRRQAVNEVTGTITASLSDYRQSGNRCRAATSFEAVPADRHVAEHPSADTYGRGFTGGDVAAYAGHAGFDYANHRVSQFNAAVEIRCPDGSRFPFLLDSAARALDPISVGRSGAFAVSGLAPLAGRGNIVQFSLTGQIRGKRASGTVRAAVAILYPKLEACSTTQHWSATAR